MPFIKRGQQANIFICIQTLKALISALLPFNLCQSALKSIHLTASNNVQQESKVMPFLAPFCVA
jgi:hypothetical protein